MTTQQPWDNHQLVFVGGLHRSGTTPLARVLAGHPDVAGLAGTGVKEDEGQHLQDVYDRARLHGGPGRFALDPTSHLTEDSPLVNAESALRLWQAWAPYWDVEKKVLVEKSPPNVVMSRFLQALFPDAVFVFIVRHPIVVALSTDKWVHGPLSRSVENWLAAHRYMQADLAHLRRHVVIRYEDLIADADAALEQVRATVGLSTAIDAGAIRPDRSQRYVERWERLGRRYHPGRWAREQLIKRYEDEVASFGYDLRTLQTLGNSFVNR